MGVVFIAPFNQPIGGYQMDLIYLHTVYTPTFLAFFMGFGLLGSRSVYVRALAFLVPASASALMASAVMLAPDAVENELTEALKMQCIALFLTVVALLFVYFILWPLCKRLEEAYDKWDSKAPPIPL
jgi:hypothetical protein